MGLRQFFLGNGFFPWRNPKEVLRELFILCYGVPGFSCDLSEATPADREAWLKMLVEMKEREAAALKGKK